ncbi:MAG: inositol-phosphate phosphatase [Thiothrix sp.]|nr:inositol-phosphate phosphatase [Thiothrix sp.]
MKQSPFLQAALDAARAAEAVIRKYYAQGVEVQLKPDQSPVTIADIETEQTIRSLILERFPEHGFYGEETGKVNPDAEYNWLIDPIDGTKSFVRRYPFFSTQIALMQGDELILGVSNAPEFGQLAHAEKGGGAFLNGERIHTSAYAELPKATLSLGNIATLAGKPQWQNLGRIVREVNRIRGYGDFYHYHLLASGSVDAVLESDLNILDIAALSVIVREAGGAFTDLYGNPPGLATTSVLAAATPALHRQLSERLQYC